MPNCSQLLKYFNLLRIKLFNQCLRSDDFANDRARLARLSLDFVRRNSFSNLYLRYLIFPVIVGDLCGQSVKVQVGVQHSSWVSMLQLTRYNFVIFSAYKTSPQHTISIYTHHIYQQRGTQLILVILPNTRQATKLARMTTDPIVYTKARQTPCTDHGLGIKKIIYTHPLVKDRVRQTFF